MLARLFQDRGRAFVFDEQQVPGATTDDLDNNRLGAFFAHRPTTIPWPDLLRNTRVTATGENEADRPTLSGLLAFGKAPQAHLPSAYVEAAVYRGSRLTSDDLVHSESIKGRVDAQIDDSRAFVERFMLKPARKPSGREDHPQYEIGAVHEAIVNAVAHRDYSIAGSKIRLFLFADRLELYSPGSLPNTITLDTMPYRVFTRNQLLVSFLSRMKSRRTGHAFLESRGEGRAQDPGGERGTFRKASGVCACSARSCVSPSGPSHRPHDGPRGRGGECQGPMTASQNLANTTGQTPSTSIVGTFMLTTTFMLRMRNG